MARTYPKKNTVQVRLGGRVRNIRKSRGWSQEELADACNLHRTYIGGIERVERNVSVRNVEKIAVALGVAIGKLFEGK